jgi:hypothetical protein
MTFARGLLYFENELPANGLRYPRWGGRRNAVQTEKTNSVEKCLRFRQTPQRRVHALLGGIFRLRFSLTGARFYL